MNGFPGVSVGHVNGTDSLNLPGTEDQDFETTDVWDDIVDNEEEEKAYRLTKPPGGNYLVLEGMTATRSKRETEYVQETPDGPRVIRQPRPSIRFSGRGTKETETGTITPRLSFSISPVKGYKRNFETKEIVTPPVYDRDHEMYNLARRAYVDYYGLGKDAKFKVSDVEEFLKTQPLEIRTFMPPSGDSLMVQGIKGVKAS